MRKKVLSELEKSKVETLESVGVDLTQVKDIRKALRRKFASRSNIDRIF
jgi:hypothetical protein